MINKDLLNHYIHTLLLLVHLLLIQRTSYHILGKLFHLLNFPSYYILAARGGIEPPTSSGNVHTQQVNVKAHPFQAVVNRRCGSIKPYPFDFYSVT